MLTYYKIKQEIKEIEDYKTRLERHLEVHTQRLKYLESISSGNARIIYTIRLAKFVRGINQELVFLRRDIKRHKDLVATLAA